MRKRAVGRFALVVALCAVLALGGCSHSDTHAFDQVEAAASTVGVESLGTVDYQGRFGSGRFSDTRPTLIYVLSGDGVKDHVDKALTDAAYTPQITDQPAGKSETWKHGDDAVLVSVVVLPAGSTFQDAAQKDRTVEHDSVLVQFTS